MGSVALDFSQMKPLAAQPGGNTTLDFSKSTPIGGNPTSPPPAPITDSVSAPQPRTLEQIMGDFQQDVTNGGGRTAVGRLLGQLQGRGDKGYSGLNSGVSQGAASFVGSPLMGTAEALHAATTIPEHPLKGTLQTIGGILHAAAIPGMVMGGPAANAAAEAIPSAAHAGQMLGDIQQAAGHLPVTINNALSPLERTQQLAMAGASPARPADLLYQRVNSIAPLSYQEARDFASNIANLTRQERLGLNGPMQAAVQRLKTGLNADIGSTAGQVGKAEDYANAIKEYAQAKQLKQGMVKASKYLAGTALGAAAYTEGKKVLGVFGK